jgi:hypothetical protein
MEEIRVAVFAIGADRASDPDVFLMSFYQTYWDVVETDLFNMFEDFFNDRLNIAKLNRAIICLIPKISNVALVAEFRPIRLLNCRYKIFSKVLAINLQVVLNEIIG